MPGQPRVEPLYEIQPAAVQGGPMLLDRRQFLMLGAAAAAAAILPGQRVATVANVRICNTDHHRAAAELFRSKPGTPLELRFEYDPGWVQGASAAFWLNGVKVGDAPRPERERLGRMLLAGRRLDALLETIRAPTEHDGWAARAIVRLHRGALNPPLVRPVDPGFMQAEAEDLGAARFVQLVGKTAGAPPTYLGGGYVNGARASDAATGEPLRLYPFTGPDGRRRAAYHTIDGRRLGTAGLYDGRMLARMAASGVILGAVVLPRLPHNDTLWVADYLLG